MIKTQRGVERSDVAFPSPSCHVVFHLKGYLSAYFGTVFLLSVVLCDSFTAVLLYILPIVGWLDALFQVLVYPYIGFSST